MDRNEPIFVPTNGGQGLKTLKIKIYIENKNAIKNSIVICKIVT